MGKARKLTLTPLSEKAKRLGDRPRNVLVEMEEGERMFVRFEGWNRWTWVKKSNDPHYSIKRGWSDAGFPISTKGGIPRD